MAKYWKVHRGENKSSNKEEWKKVREGIKVLEEKGMDQDGRQCQPERGRG